MLVEWTNQVINGLQTLQNVTRRAHLWNTKPQVKRAKTRHLGTWGSRGRRFKPLDKLSLIEVDGEPPAEMREVLFVSGMTGSHRDR